MNRTRHKPEQIIRKLKTAEELTSHYRAPTCVHSDNGHEFIIHARKHWCKRSSPNTSYIEPGSPWQNGIAESIISRFKYEFFNTELFATVAEALGLAEELAL